MKVLINVVGWHPRPEVTWPEGWPVPRIGDQVQVKDKILFVRDVCWYPLGDREDIYPFVYVVVGPERIL